ncbi:MAG: hypothetical protein WBG86_06835 [Polyangiales bacterium]
MMTFRFLLALGILSLAGGGCEDTPAQTGFGQECGEDLVPRPTCEDFCATAVTECGAFQTPTDVCGEICECQLEEGTDFMELCGTAWEAEYACAATLSCPDFVDYFTRGDGTNFPCRDEAIATDSACLGTTAN